MRVWLDTEFNGFRGELISMALVDETGREWYEVLGCSEPVPWVAAHVMPALRKRRTTLQRMQRSLSTWMHQFDRVHVIADWPADFAYFTNLLLTRPGFRLAAPPITMELIEDLEPVSAVPHNALEDARALRGAHLATSAGPTWLVVP